jgi:hypothetical protein
MADLAAMYAQLLAGNRLVPLPETRIPLTACAFAVLLLPLERPLADQVAMLSHLPSTRLDLKRFSPGDGAAVAWHLIGCGDSNSGLLPPPACAPGKELQAIGATMAQALLDNDPGLASRARQAAPPQQPASPPDQDALENRSPGYPPIPHQSVPPLGEGTREIRIWGAASSGKTAYLAQLFTKSDHGGDPDWSVSLPPGSDQTWFKRRLEDFQKENRFAEATNVDANDEIRYRLINARTGHRATIFIDDRPGVVSQTFDQETARRFAAADGLLLLIDPMRDRGTQNDEVKRAFMAMQQERRDDHLDPRPLAVCVSKCDEYIHTVADFHRANKLPQVFLRDLIGRFITGEIARYFSNSRVFALSAAGLCIAHGAVSPSVFYDENFELRIKSDGRPMNLLEPLVWIIEEIRA